MTSVPPHQRPEQFEFNFESQEAWLPIAGWEGWYSVSDQGRVRSEDRVVPSPARPLGHRIKGRLIAKTIVKGYEQVCLCRDGRNIKKLVHMLVLEAFDRPPGQGEVCRHLNDVPTDNRLENLKWGTRTQNNWDLVRNGRNAESRKTHCKHGHPFDESNTKITVVNGRIRRKCLTCSRGNAKRWIAENPVRRRANKQKANGNLRQRLIDDPELLRQKRAYDAEKARRWRERKRDAAAAQRRYREAKA